MSRSDYFTQRRAEAKAKGLCTSCCIRKARPGRAWCKVCAEANSAYYEKQKPSLIDRVLGRRSERIVKKRCGQCSAFLNPDNGDTPQMCRTCCEKRNHYQKRRRKAATAERKCADCGKCPAVRGATRCATCAKLQAEATKRWKRNAGDAEKCVQCGRSAMRSMVGRHTHPLCEKCYLKKAAYRNLGSVKHWVDLREMLEKQGYRCALTGKRLTLGINDSIDHKYPVSRFPHLATRIDNVHWVTRAVNNKKLDKTVAEFLACRKRSSWW